MKKKDRDYDGDGEEDGGRKYWPRQAVQKRQ